LAALALVVESLKDFVALTAALEFPGTQSILGNLEVPRRLEH
jgi:hypothetical protein